MGLLYYPLLIVGLGVLILLFVWNPRLALRPVWTLVKLFIIAFLILLVRSFLGLWQLPRPGAQFFFGLR